MLNESSDTQMSADDRLAVDGGQPALDHADLTWPPNDPQIKAAIDAIYQSGHWGRYSGPASNQLKQRLSDYFLREYVVLCSSGTIGIELALRGTAVKAGDEVVLSAYDFPGNFRAIEAIGATPVLIDVAPNTWKMNIHELASAIGPKTQAIIASHLHGELLAMNELMELANANQLAVIEDLCQCPGAIIDGKRAGQWGDVSVCSFGGSKLLSAGRGGAIMSSRQEIIQRINVFSDRGNQCFPMSELQAAVLPHQLNELDHRNRQRLDNARRIHRELSSLNWLKFGNVFECPQRSPAFYKLAMILNHEASNGWSRDRIVASLQAEGVPIDAGFRGFAKRSPRRCRKINNCTHALGAAESVMIIHHPVLLGSDQTIEQLLQAFRKVNQAIHRS